MGVVVVFEALARQIHRRGSGVVNFYPIAGCSAIGFDLVYADGAGLSRTSGSCRSRNRRQLTEDSPGAYLYSHSAVNGRAYRYKEDNLVQPRETRGATRIKRRHLHAIDQHFNLGSGRLVP
jgi:hypothetical protein